MSKIIFTLLFSLFCAVTEAEELKISATESLSFYKPDTFQFRVARDPDDQFRPSLKFSHFGSNNIKDFGFKLFINKSKEGELPTDNEIKKFTKVNCEQYKNGSVEGKINLVKIPGENTGYYCSFTDASLSGQATLLPGQYRNITVGFIKNGQFGFNIILYSNEKSGALFSEFLKTLGSLRISEISGGSS